ncbi:hypothetical protein LINPERHAP1_LOCUS35607 [Linum perenne]
MVMYDDEPLFAELGYVKDVVLDYCATATFSASLFLDVMVALSSRCPGRHLEDSYRDGPSDDGSDDMCSFLFGLRNHDVKVSINDL